MKYDVLLICPKSIKHGPPSELENIETKNAIEYSNALNNRCINYLNNASVSNKRIDASSFNKKYMVNYGLLMLSAMLEDNGISNIYLIPDFYTDDEFEIKLSEYSKEARVVCFTSTTPQYNYVLSIKDIVVKNNPNAILLFGGPQAFAHKFIINDGFDYIHVGYDMAKTFDLVKKILENPQKPSECQLLFSNGFTDYRKNFDILPNEYAKKTLLYSFFDFGCPNNCSYCIEHKLTNCMNKGNIYMKINEIKKLVEDYEIKFVHIADSDFLLFQNRARAIISILKQQNFNCCFSINVSTKSLCFKDSISLLREFSEIGLVEILVGVEHFSTETMNKMHKSIDIKAFYSALNEIRKIENSPLISFYTLVGLPFEYKNNIKENIQNIEICSKYDLCDFTFPKFFVPYPGTDIFENPQDFDVEILNYKWENYHRWGLPRPILINKMSDQHYIDEIQVIHDVFYKKH